MNEAIRMQLSAFVDGELPENEKELLLRRLSHDVELRRELSEYLAIGRAMRGELQLAGIDTLRDRIAGTVDDNEYVESTMGEKPSIDRRLRPLAGFAIAATVALAAIFGLRQFSAVDDVLPDATAESTTADAGFPTEPPVDELLRQMLLRHDADASENSIRAVLTAIEFGSEGTAEEQSVEDDASVDEIDEPTPEDQAAE